jgi:mercuric ion transport protein
MSATPQRQSNVSAGRAVGTEARQRPGRWQALLAAGGLAGGVAAMSCCILPLALFSVGLTGAWIGALTALSPYQPVFVIFAMACLGGGFYLASRRRAAAACSTESCGTAASHRLVRGALWTAAALIAASLAWPYLAPRLLGI